MLKVLAVLLLVLLSLQYRLLVSPDGIRQIWQLQEAISHQKQENVALKVRNEELEAEVIDLKEGLGTIETRARRDLGMIHKDETFFQFVDY
uniref:Cell division protein FtsB n=1 Tax=Candidatus Kentrum sp. MB TaxID=2138164 RepID=A0A450X2J6_9GAMM|nr:MAG: cell division protein FtsB [Candidatus Kentron sp. MB]VFK27921.1 MAG: cell division protein FtsB [Candidatus Kentron sp. MB]VFK74465.1 MAG: cell division protein FtsB [Candidatus Kentron sp. MB]